MPLTTPYESQEEAFEGRVRSMGYFVGQVQQLAETLGAVRQTIAEMEAAGFPVEYGIMEPVRNLERSATIQVQPKITAFLEAYQALLQEAAPEPDVEAEADPVAE